MDNLLLKELTTLSILAIAIIGGMISLAGRAEQKPGKLILFGEQFSRGIFLGAGLIHLLPEAASQFSKAFPHTDYPMVMMLCALTMFLLQFIEQGCTKFFSEEFRSQHWLPFLLMVLLSIHSIIAGVALGFSTSSADILLIGFAILIHKGAEAFALGINLRSKKIDRKTIFKTLILFALMTPLGIIGASSINPLLTGPSGEFTHVIFSSIASGTFLYIATFHCLNAHKDHPHIAIPNLLYFGLGIAVMSLGAIWL